MIAPRVISLDLDDTLWPVAPVIAAAEKALFDWLKSRYPQAAQGHSVGSMRSLRASIAAQFPKHSHDLSCLRRPRAPFRRSPKSSSTVMARISLAAYAPGC